MVPFYTGCGPVLSTHFFFATTIRALRLSHFTSDAATLQPSHVLHHILRPSHFTSGTSAVYCLLSFILVVLTVNHFFLPYFRLYWPHLLVVFSSAGSLQRVLSFSPPKKILDSFCFPFLLLRGLPAPFIPFCSCALQCLLAHCSVHFPFLLRGGLRVPFLFFV